MSDGGGEPICGTAADPAAEKAIAELGRAGAALDRIAAALEVLALGKISGDFSTLLSNEEFAAEVKSAFSGTPGAHRVPPREKYRAAAKAFMRRRV